MKRIIALLLACMMVVSTFTACKDKKEKEETQGLPEKLNFDFGVDSSYTADGWTAVTVNKKNATGAKGYKYTVAQGYGFKTEADVFGRKETETSPEGEVLPKEVFMDYALAKGLEFVVDVPNGYYTVQIVIGTISDSTTTVTVEGKKTEALGTPKKYSVTTLENVQVKDGQINFKFDGTGMQGGLINAITIVNVDVPKNLKGTSDYKSKSVSLTWEAAKGADCYYVYRTDVTGNTVVFKDVKETTYVDTTVEELEKYSYYVTGATMTGAQSAPTETLTFSLVEEGVTVTGAPQNVVVSEITENKTVISWDKVEGAHTYAVYWSNKKGVEGSLKGYQLLTKTTETSAVNEASTFNRRYYKVVAGNAGGYSDYTLLVAPSGVDMKVQLEFLDRSAVAIKVEKGVYLGWKLAVDEYEDEREFELYRDDVLVKKFTSDEATNYIDEAGSAESKYVIKAVKDGVVLNETEYIEVIGEQYIEIPLDVPKAEEELPDGAKYTYHANDTALGDVDGDGVYEYFVKWSPSNAKDNAQAGYTGVVYIDCYKLDGTKLWRINLGRNIRAGAHYTQMAVYDFDGDGCAELICKTADATIDGVGNVIGDKDADYRNDGGYILSGPEFLTLFDGKTGANLHTIDYNPGRGNVSSWGDNYGNRVDRMLCAVGYLDGEKPSAIFARGYYTRAVVVAYDVVDKKLVEKWVCDSNDKENKKLAGQGAHYTTVADVDGDGFDEIIYGSATIDHDGKFMYAIGDVNNNNSGGHGDAFHVTDINLDNPGLEIFMVHEGYPNDAGVDIHDAATGKYILGVKTGNDVGRGAAGDIDPNYEGMEVWANGIMYSSDGTPIANTMPAANFVIWWDGDLGREILDHKWSGSSATGIPLIQKWNWKKLTSDQLIRFDGTNSNNHTKGNVCIQADIFGDWREEVVTRTSDSSALRIYTTTDYSDFRLYTLMHDAQYRCQVASQNVAYNQPPHTSFYIGFDVELIEVPIRQYNIIGNN